LLSPVAAQDQEAESLWIEATADNLAHFLPRATLEVATTGEPVALGMSSDRNIIGSDRRDIAHLAVRILDEKGRLVPTADNEVTFSIEGEGMLLGVDNGDPQSHEDFKSNHRKAFNGPCLAILQSTGKQGRIRVKASSPALESATAVVATRV
jgi:beta-galactosidase